jgi:hypothetical protein
MLTNCSFVKQRKFPHHNHGVVIKVDEQSRFSTNDERPFLRFI